jgi:hypothetical protein
MPRQRHYVVRIRVEPADRITAARIRIGKGAWQGVKPRMTNKCLAGAVESGHVFCEVEAYSSNQPVEIRLELSRAT